MGSDGRRVEEDDYRRLLAWRSSLRHFLRWSEEVNASMGVTTGQYQLLLAVRGHRDPRGPAIGDVADYLALEHHSAVGLVDRASVAGLIERTRDHDDLRVVRLRLTSLGAELIEQLAERHLDELTSLADQLGPVFDSWRGRRE